jgi:hypothetical protein
VSVIEGRGRIGGRVHSARERLGDAHCTVELGAAVLMGDVRGGNPLARLCSKHNIPTHKLNNSCPLHDVASAGALLPPDADVQAEKLFNQLLEMAHEERSAPAADGSCARPRAPHAATAARVAWHAPVPPTCHCPHAHAPTASTDAA